MGKLNTPEMNDPETGTKIHLLCSQPFCSLADSDCPFPTTATRSRDQWLPVRFVFDHNSKCRHIDLVSKLLKSIPPLDRFAPKLMTDCRPFKASRTTPRPIRRSGGAGTCRLLQRSFTARWLFPPYSYRSSISSFLARSLRFERNGMVLLIHCMCHKKVALTSLRISSHPSNIRELPYPVPY